MWAFIGKLLGSTLLWCCSCFNFTQFVILENLSSLDLALSGVKGLNSLITKQATTFSIRGLLTLVRMKSRSDSISVYCVLFINYHKFYRKQYPLPAVSRLASRGEQCLHVCNIYTNFRKFLLLSRVNRYSHFLLKVLGVKCRGH